MAADKRQNPRAWRDLVAAGVLATLVVALASLPYLFVYLSTPPDLEFGGLLSNPQDGNSYLAKMQEGARGEWLFHLPYTAEDHAGGFLFPYYLTLGHVAALLDAPLLLVYHVARVGGGFFLLGAAYLFFAQTLVSRPARWVAFLLFALGSGLGWLTTSAGHLTPDLLVPELTAFHAMFANPHFPVGIGLLLLTLTGLSRALVRSRPLWAIGAGISALLAVLVQPFLAVTIYAVGGVWILQRLADGSGRRHAQHGRRGGSLTAPTSRQGALVGPEGRRRQAGAVDGWRAELWPDLLCWLAVIVISAPAAIVSVVPLYFDPILSRWTAQNVTPSPPPWDYLAGLGLPALLALAGWRHGRHSSALAPGYGGLLLAWVATTVVLLYLPFSLQRRFVEGLQAPVVALGAAGLVRLIPAHVPAIRRRLALAAVVVLAMPTSLLIVVVSTLAPLHTGSAYLEAADVEAMAWLRRHGSSQETVLASPESGNRIPAWAGIRVFYGHPLETVDAPAKLALARGFFGDGMTAEERHDLLVRFGIVYVFVGASEPSLGAAGLDAVPPLRPVYRRDGVTIYRHEPSSSEEVSR